MVWSLIFLGTVLEWEKTFPISLLTLLYGTTLILDLELTVIAGTSPEEQVGLRCSQGDHCWTPTFCLNLLLCLSRQQTGSLGLCKGHNSPSDCNGVWVTRFLHGRHQGLFHFHSKLLCNGEPTVQPIAAESTQLCCSLGCTWPKRNGTRAQKKNPHTLNRTLWEEGTQLPHQLGQWPNGNSASSPQSSPCFLNSAPGQTCKDFLTISYHVQKVGDLRLISPQLKNFPTFIVFCCHLNILHMLLLKTLLTFKADTY